MTNGTKRGLFKKLALAATVMTSTFATSVVADDFKDPQLFNYYDSAKGKTVAFVPIATTFDIAIEYVKGLQAGADKMGYTLEIRDPNWSVDKAVQAIDQLISEHPDIIISQPIDGDAENQLVKKAQAAGIHWIWLNLRGSVDGDVYIGANQYDLGRNQADLAAEACAGKSGKVAVVGTQATTYNARAGLAGFAKELADKHPEIKVVSSQFAEADATKAKAIAATVLKQNPDLCAFVGFWDGQDIGIAPAVAEAGLTGKVAIISQGGGSQAGACDLVKNGTFTADISQDIPAQVQDVNGVIMQIFQTQQPAGSMKWALFTPQKVLSLDRPDDFSCWK